MDKYVIIVNNKANKVVVKIMKNKKIALAEGIALIILILIAFFKNSILINLPLSSLFKYGGETLMYLKIGVFSLCITSIIQYFFIKNSTTTFFTAKGAGILAMILVIIFGIYFKQNYIEYGAAYVSFLIYCVSCIVSQITSYVLMINNKVHKAFRVLNGLAIVMTLNFTSTLSIKLLELLGLIEKSHTYIAEKIIIYIVGFTIIEIIAYTILVCKEKHFYFEKIGAFFMVACSTLIFII